MENGNPEFIAARKDLVVRELPDEIIVYDRTTYEAHCLNDTAATVWRLCDGTHSMKEIAHTLRQNTAGLIDEDVVWAAVQQFEKSGLLQNKVPARSTVSRRDLLKRIGIGAVMALPVVTSLAVPPRAAAASFKGPARKSQRSR